MAKTRAENNCHDAPHLARHVRLHAAVPEPVDPIDVPEAGNVDGPATLVGVACGVGVVGHEAVDHRRYVRGRVVHGLKKCDESELGLETLPW